MHEPSIQEKREGEAFGRLKDGRPARLYTLTSDALSLSITDYGARMVSLLAKDAPGHSIILGYDNVAAYEADPAFLGACCGRYANRIYGARYEIDGKVYNLPANDAPHTLHGGPKGFFARLWEMVSVSDDSLTLRLISPDGDQGFGGQLEVEAQFVLSGDGLTVTYVASTTKPTPISLTHHPYFNLRGAGDIHDHVLHVPATGIMNGFQDAARPHDIHDLEGHPELDFRAPIRIGDKLSALPVGIDHTYAVEKDAVFTLSHPEVARSLTVSADMPSVQVYAGANLKGGRNRPGGLPYKPFEGLCLEPQAFPDAPNAPSLPPATLRPGETYQRQIRYTYR
ncbi:aldose epimerase family protein [Parvularcula marina]|uniref:aldose epimerase family protein n=1 Tax=Parvularcula marina TaxID=2292771 RepID=UPI00351439DC